MLKVAIIIGSTRPGRKAEVVARWVYDIANKRSDAAFEIVDIKDFNLPLLDEPVPAAMGQYSQPHTKAWAAKIEQFDAFVFVTPEYNHGPSAALKKCDRFPAPRMEQQGRRIRRLWRQWRGALRGMELDQSRHFVAGEFASAEMAHRLGVKRRIAAHDKSPVGNQIRTY
jgi:multimeric flavodoxin WrbA